jgi:hypothetical protein
MPRCPQIHRSFAGCQSRRPFRMGLFASTPFIGPCRNNFSHHIEFFCGHDCFASIQAVAPANKHCRNPLQPLSGCCAWICPDSRHGVRRFNGASGAFHWVIYSVSRRKCPKMASPPARAEGLRIAAGDRTTLRRRARAYSPRARSRPRRCSRRWAGRTRADSQSGRPKRQRAAESPLRPRCRW